MEIKELLLKNGISPEKVGDIGELSDGYHTFNSLYRQRLILFAALVNIFPALSWKSHRNADGSEPFGGGWFVVGINTPEGPYTYHYEDKDWDLFRCEELARAPEWDGHTDKDVERVLSLVDRTEDFSSWAAREVDLACRSEEENSSDKEEASYGIMCYKSALRAYDSLLRDGHSGFSIKVTQSIVNRLINGKALTPIVDTPDIWEALPGGADFQCKRMSSLFKHIDSDGNVTFQDVERTICVNPERPGAAFSSGLASRLVDSLFPIKLPYLPRAEPFKVYVEEFQYDEKAEHSDFDTVGYLKVVTPSGQEVTLDRYFSEYDGILIPIKKSVYNKRKAEYERRKK